MHPMTPEEILGKQLGEMTQTELKVAMKGLQYVSSRPAGVSEDELKAFVGDALNEAGVSDVVFRNGAELLVGKLTLDEYQVQALRTANGIENQTDRRFNALLGLIGEAGELAENAFRRPAVASEFGVQYFEFVETVIDFGGLAETVKHELFHKHPKGHKIKEPELTRENRREELGDILWYLTWLCSEFGLSLEEVANANIAKLRKRYPDGFSVDRSINRVEVVK